MNSIIDKVSSALPTMSPKLAKAARYAINKPDAIALQSMRGIASEIGVAAPTMQRLALHLGFDAYDRFREAFQDELVRTGFGNRASALRIAPADSEHDGLLHRIGDAAQRNIAKAIGGCDEKTLNLVARRICEAETTYVVGSGAVNALAEVMVRSGGIVLPGLRLAEGAAATIVESICTVTKKDAIVLLGISPYAKRSLEAAEYARARGATIITLTDQRSSPMNDLAHFTLFAPAKSPHYYPSLISLLMLIEAVLAAVVANSDAATIERIRFFETVRKESGGYVGD